MRTIGLTTLILMAFAIACGEPERGAPLPTYTPYPTYTPLPAYTPYPTATAVPSPTPAPTQPPAELGVSRQELIATMEPLGYKFSKSDIFGLYLEDHVTGSKVIGGQETAEIILEGPAHNLSAVNMNFPSDSDLQVALELFVLASAISPSLGNLEWIFDGFIAGRSKVVRYFGNIEVTGEVSQGLGEITIDIDFVALAP